MPPPIAGASFSSLGSSTTTASVVVISEDTLQYKHEYKPQHLNHYNSIECKCSPRYYIRHSWTTSTNIFLPMEPLRNCQKDLVLESIAYLAASTKAVLITFNGSMIPAFTMSTYSPAQREVVFFHLGFRVSVYYYWNEEKRNGNIRHTFGGIITKVRIILLQELTNNNGPFYSSITSNSMHWGLQVQGAFQ